MPAAAQKILTEAQFKRGVRYSKEHLDQLNDFAAGRKIGRNASVSLGALRLKAEYAYAKPAQEHELSGSVTIVVQSQMPSRRQAQHVVVEAVEKTAERVDSPVMGRYVNSLPEPQDVVVEPMLAPSVIEDGKLVGAPDNRSAEQRRADERDAWQAEQAAIREAGE